MRFVRSIALSILKPFICAYMDKQNRIYVDFLKRFEDACDKNQRETLQNLEITLEHVRETYDKLYQQLKMDINDQMEQGEQRISILIRQQDKMRNNMGALARQIMLAKWKIIDHLREETEHPDDLLTCKICGESHKRKEYETKETECIFNGGHLVRYVCPGCGAIFGPSKFEDQGQAGIDEDYRVHYLGFSEGDSTEKEIRAFYMLNPKKNKVYLNYGCGNWSQSLRKLREEGYNVYGYEPYAIECDNPYLIIDRDQLSKMRFDGIYSNDVLEHLINPIKELKFMSDILIPFEGKMSHCTTCYMYKNEFTRFHTCFFTGDSVKILAKRAGLEITDVCNDMEKKDFFCYVYRPVEWDHLINRMYVYDNAEIKNARIRINCDGMVYGPYLQLLPRQYILCIKVINQETRDSIVRITTNAGINILLESRLYGGINRIPFKLDRMQNDVEFVIRNNSEEIVIGDLWLE